MATFTIGRLAEAAAVHVETVRYYERRGLIAPPPRSPGGYRQYGEEDLWRLQFISRGKALGFTLAEIGDLLDGGGSPEGVGRAAEAKIAAIEEEQRRLADVHCRLRRLARLCHDGADADCTALRLPA
jgi:MerR family transcriptional regulator, mercuric resistance operon regulatory protein